MPRALKMPLRCRPTRIMRHKPPQFAMCSAQSNLTGMPDVVVGNAKKITQKLVPQAREAPAHPRRGNPAYAG
jgi:hypothetical protein